MSYVLDRIAINLLNLEEPANVDRVAQINRLLRQIVYSGELPDTEGLREYTWEIDESQGSIIFMSKVARRPAPEPDSPFARRVRAPRFSAHPEPRDPEPPEAA